MEEAAHADPEAWLQQSLPVLKVRLSSDSWTPQARKLKTAKIGQTLRQVKQVKVSPKVRQVTNPSRQKEEQRYLPKMPHHHQIQNPAPSETPPMPQQ